MRYGTFAMLTAVIVSDVDLGGTASGFSSGIENTEKFYVYYFARNCSGFLTACRSTRRWSQWRTIKVIQRNYVVPGTVRGADPRMLLNPSVIVLNKEHMRLHR